MASTANRAPANVWTIIDDGTALQLRIRVTPKSSRDAIDGMTQTPDGPAIKARVRAVPENGAANKALIATVAKWLSVPKSNISLSAGGKSRNKILIIVADTGEIERISNWIEERSSAT